MFSIIFTAAMLTKETTGMVMDSIRLKLGTNLIMLLRLLDGIWKKEDFKKISNPEKLDQDFSILPDVYHWAGEPTKLSLVLSPSNSREQTNSSLSHLKIHSMTMLTVDSKDILKKEMIQLEPSRIWRIVVLKSLHGAAMSSKSSMVEESQ